MVMPLRSLAPAIMLAISGCSSLAEADRPVAALSDAHGPLIEFLRERRTTGFLAIQHGRTIVEANLDPPAVDPAFAMFAYGEATEGALLEDVASMQKSFVAVLVAIAIDRKLIDPDQPMNTYLGAGWSRATPDQEAAIRVIDILTMTSGLDDRFAYRTPPGTRFHYNTPVYAIAKTMLENASGRSIEQLTREWLTRPLGMSETSWRQRPAALGNVGNATALVTTPRDIARLGEMILRRGLAPSGERVVSEVELRRLFLPSPGNPSYGRLWWLNSGAYAIGAAGVRREGRLIPGAPADLVAALGFLDRRLYVVPSLGLVVVRTGAAADAPDFDAELWAMLEPHLSR